MDLYFVYKYNLRNILINKIGYYNNSYQIPNINKLILFFSLKKLDDLDDVQIYNYFYLFKFFFGKKAYFTKIKKFFYLGVWYYNFDIKLIINKKKEIYWILYKINNDLIYNVDNDFLEKGNSRNNMNIFFFIIKDLNIYSELKTNLGLFNILLPLNINIYINNNNNEGLFIYNLIKNIEIDLKLKSKLKQKSKIKIDEYKKKNKLKDWKKKKN